MVGDLSPPHRAAACNGKTGEIEKELIPFPGSSSTSSYIDYLFLQKNVRALIFFTSSSTYFDDFRAA